MRVGHFSLCVHVLLHPTCVIAPHKCYCTPRVLLHPASVTALHMYYYTPQVLQHSTCVITPPKCYCTPHVLLHPPSVIAPHDCVLHYCTPHVVVYPTVCHLLPLMCYMWTNTHFSALHVCCIPVQVRTLFSSWLQTRMVHGESKSSSSSPPTARTELGGVRVCCGHKHAMWECMYVCMYICRYIHHSDSLCVHVCVCVCARACV